MFGFDGATTTAPIDAANPPSKIGFNVTPTSAVFHTQPPSAPIKSLAGYPVTPATPFTLPARNGPIIRHSISEYREGGSSSANEIRAAWICTINRNARPTAARMSFLLIISVHVLLFAPFLMAGRPHRG